MRHHLRPLTAIAALCVATSVALPTAARADTDTLVYCAEAAPRSFDPAAYFDGATMATVSLPLFDRLVDYEPGTTDLVPSLAESWSVSDDGMTYTFKLRPGVAFHETEWFTPTRRLTSEDVVFSFARQFFEDHPWYGENDAGAYGPLSDMREWVKSIEAPDEATVVFHLNQPYAPFLTNLAMGTAAIVSAEYAANLDAGGDRTDFAARPIGTGPYQFVGYTKDVAARHRAHPAHWRGPAKTRNLVVAIATDQAVRTEKVVAGECHVAPYPSPAELARLRALPQVTVHETAGLNYAYFAFNTLQEPFDDQRVRRAIAMAIDKESIISAVYDGRAVASRSPVPPTLWGHNAEAPMASYDPAGARALLAEAGVEDLTMTVCAMPVQRDYNPNGRRMAELILADLAEVGITAEIVSYEWAEYLKRSKDEERDGAVLLGWVADIVDPENFLSPMFKCASVGGSNRANWCNPAYQALIDEAATATSDAIRTELYAEAQVIFANDLPHVPIAHAYFADIASDRVEGYVQEPMGWHRFHAVSLKPE